MQSILKYFKSSNLSKNLSLYKRTFHVMNLILWIWFFILFSVLSFIRVTAVTYIHVLCCWFHCLFSLHFWWSKKLKISKTEIKSNFFSFRKQNDNNIYLQSNSYLVSLKIWPMLWDFSCLKQKSTHIIISLWSVSERKSYSKVICLQTLSGH